MVLFFIWAAASSGAKKLERLAASSVFPLDATESVSSSSLSRSSGWAVGEATESESGSSASESSLARPKVGSEIWSSPSSPSSAPSPPLLWDAVPAPNPSEDNNSSSSKPEKSAPPSCSSSSLQSPSRACLLWRLYIGAVKDVPPTALLLDRCVLVALRAIISSMSTVFFVLLASFSALLLWKSPKCHPSKSSIALVM